MILVLVLENLVCEDVSLKCYLIALCLECWDGDSTEANGSFESWLSLLTLLALFYEDVQDNKWIFAACMLVMVK